jgi:hypothetical protein
MRFTRLFWFGIVLAAAGCHPGSSAPPPPTDGPVYDFAIDLPPGCPPATQNEKGVGIPCTRGGNECKRSGVPSGLLCTCDPLPIIGAKLNGVPCICTIGGPNLSTNPDPCTANNVSCGSGATCCAYTTVGYYCSPDVCLPGGQCIQFTPIDAGTKG